MYLCPIAARLYLSWMSSIAPFPPMMIHGRLSEADQKRLRVERREDYQDGLSAYRTHRAECPECRSIWNETR